MIWEKYHIFEQTFRQVTKKVFVGNRPENTEQRLELGKVDGQPDIA